MRIIAGKYKGKVLNDFSHEGTRPTSDKARGGIFNTLIFEIDNGIVLDLFGGTGAMGIEAESRGAKRVFIVDNNLSSIQNINDNCRKCKTENITVLQKDYLVALKYFQSQNLVFDVIFIDPPYKEDYAQKAIDLIFDYKLINSDSIICYEHNDLNSVHNENFDLIKQRKYGIAYVDYYKLKEDN